MSESSTEQTGVMQIPASTEPPTDTDITRLKEAHKSMGTLPFLTTQDLTGGLEGTAPIKEQVPVSAIVAAPNLKDWSGEYHKDWQQEGLSSVEALALKIKKGPDLFWRENQHPVRLTRVNGPKGPIYAVEDGSHRVAAAKLAEAPSLPAEVTDITDLTRFSSGDEVLISWWRALLAAGAIRGKIEQNLKESVLELDEVSPIPWIVRGRVNFVAINTVYSGIYGEEALVEMTSLPRDVLFNQGKAMVWENAILREAEQVQEAPA